MPLYVVILVLAVGANASSVRADPGDQIYSIPNPYPEDYAKFGQAVLAIRPALWAVSAPGARRDSVREGTVHVFDPTGPGLQLRLHRPQPQDSSGFGHALAAFDGRLFVADPWLAVRTDREQKAVGAVHVFAAREGGHLHSIVNPDPRGNDYFGWAVKAWQEGILVSALVESLSRGAVYYFDHSTFELRRSWRAQSGDGDGFGRALDADGQWMVVGAPRYDGGGGSVTNSGIAYVYDVLSGEQVSRLDNPSATADDGFGAALAITTGGRVIVGTEFGGKAFVFDLRSGALQRTFEAPPGARGYYGSLVFSQEKQTIVGSTYGWLDVFESPLSSVRRSFEAPESKRLPTDSGSVISLTAAGEIIVIGNSGVRWDHEGGGFANDSGSVFVVEGLSLGPLERFLRGDSNEDARVDIADAIWLISFLFRGGRAPRCDDAADSNDDGQVNLADVVYTLRFQLFAGPTPPEPFPVCGGDPAGADHLLCEGYGRCEVIDLVE